MSRKGAPIENVTSVQETETVSAPKPYRDVLACLIAYPLAILVLIKIVVSANAVAIKTYEDIGAAIPALTMLAVRVANALAYQAFFWIFGLAAGGGLLLVAVLLLVAIALPQFRQ